MFVMGFANYKSRALSHDPSSDCAIPRAEVHVRAQASYGNITVLSHLNHTVDPVYKRPCNPALLSSRPPCSSSMFVSLSYFYL